MRKLKSIVVVGRLWRDTSGNTYHTAEIIANGNHVGATSISYGYGRQYEQTAFVWIVANANACGIRLPSKPSDADTLPFSRWCESHGIAYHATACHVAKKADL